MGCSPAVGKYDCFRLRLVFLVQATSHTGCAAGGDTCELTLLQVQATKNRTRTAAASAGQCTLADEAKMKKFGSGNHAGSFPGVLAVCGRNAWSWRGWRRNNMEECIRKTVKISAPCTQCFSEAGQYGYKKCKRQRLRKWCSKRCLGCIAK